MKFLETLASYIPSIIVDELQSQIESGGLKTAPYRTEFDTVNEDVGSNRVTCNTRLALVKFAIVIPDNNYRRSFLCTDYRWLCMVA